jgi:hypothetical protein
MKWVEGLGQGAAQRVNCPLPSTLPHDLPALVVCLFPKLRFGSTHSTPPPPHPTPPHPTPPRSKQTTETGRIVNLMSSDVNQLQMFFYPFASQLLTGPIMIIVSLVLLWFQIRLGGGGGVRRWRGWWR